MKNFKDGGFKKGGFSGRPKFGGNKFGGDKRRGDDSSGGGRDRGGHSGKPEMFSTTCSTCGKSCEVPFRPSGDKPVYCSECFTKRNPDESGDSRGGGHRDGGRRSDSRSERPDFKKLPRDQRPPRHDPSRGRQDDGLDEIKQKLATIESRLNRILDLINPPTPPTDVVASEKVVKKVVKKTVAKKETKPKTEKKKAPTKKKVVKKVVKKP